MALIKGNLDFDIRLARLIHVSQQLRAHFIPSIKLLRKLAYLPVSLNGCSKKVASEGAFRHVHRAREVSHGLITFLEPVQEVRIVVLLNAFLDQALGFGVMPALAEDISYFKDVVVLYVFCLRQRIIESSQFEQPIDDVVVALRLKTDTQEGLVSDGIAFQSQQEYVDVFVIFAHIVSMPIDIKVERFAYPLCDHAPFLRRG